MFEQEVVIQVEARPNSTKSGLEATSRMVHKGRRPSAFIHLDYHAG
jgi:hypothetical protein